MAGSSSFYEMRRRNVSDVLEGVRRSPGISRAELAKSLELAKATVSAIVDDLIVRGALKESGIKTSNGGRPGVGLEFNPNYGYVLGCSLDDSEISACILNLNGELVNQFNSKIDRTWNGSQIVRFLLAGLQQFQNKNALEVRCIVSVGVAVPGPVSEEESKDQASSFLETKKVTQILASKIGCRPIIESNTNMAALAELKDNNIPDSKVAVVVRVGHKVRSATICDGHLLSGNSGLSGEFGHIIVPNNKRHCDCGNRGCINTLASTESMIRIAQESGLKVKTIRSLLDLAEKNNEIAQLILAEAGKSIGFGIGQVLNLLAPHMVIIAGSAVREDDLIMRFVRKKITKSSTPENRKNCQIIAGSSFRNSECFGAALLALKKLMLVDTCLPLEKIAAS